MAVQVEPIEVPGLQLYNRGKVRETFDLGDKLLMVASDRISAYDSILPTGIPNKGIVLTQLSKFWFEHTGDMIPNHMVTTDLGSLPVTAQVVREKLDGRSMIVRKAKRIDVECVARGYLSGSAWAEYQQTGSVVQIPLPAGLTESAKLPEPIFTPATKSFSGHDINIPFERVVETVGDELAERLRAATLRLYAAAEALALSHGIIIADTKFEFGLIDGELTLIDEALTPDSSRFWDVATYAPGRAQASYDKQFVRDWLNAAGWNREPPAPELPAEIAQATSNKYIEAFERLTGRSLFPLS